MPTIIKVILPFDPRLGRNVNHDSRSRRFPMRVEVAPDDLVAVRHESFIDILDQGSVGSCTGNAGDSCVHHAPFFTSGQVEWPKYPGTEEGAVALYTRATQLDDYQGDYPQQDTGSDGLSIAKALREAGIISGWLNGFSLDAALSQLQKTALITGIPFYRSMFSVPANGLFSIDVRSGLAGGHELCVDEFIPAVGNSPAQVAGPNSWGTSWGDGGRFRMVVSDWAFLLSQQGDTTSFVPLTQPAPQPTPGPVPDDDPDDTLEIETRVWRKQSHVGANAKAAKSVRDWVAAKGR